ncbi:MAG: Hpt domain-containing protein [Sulfurimonas sp.]|nr:Hpt domain-containing protein [Sulfurimonas sp.]
MLLYNSKKEFLGIDEFDLQSLGLKSLSDLLAISSDISNLFVKTPGYIHNFKHVHWIDFITCADSTEAPKVIIHLRGDNYKCTLKITTFYLSDAPTSQAFLVNLQNLRKLTPNETLGIADDIPRQQAPIVPLASHFDTDIVSITPTRPTKEDEEIILHEKVSPSAVYQTTYNDKPLDIDIDESDEIVPPVQPVVIKKTEPVTVPKIKIQEPKVIHTQAAHVEPENEYVFDPHVASKELGLPVDLIEEFIQDFIAQAKEFKADLYTALDAADIANVKILSHKLKGVAANLRVADAFDTLSVVNTSTDLATIEINLDKFYRIIAKLSGEKLEPRSEEDAFVVDFKDEDISDEFYLKKDENNIDEPLELSITDDDELSILKMPELADDDFSPILTEGISSEHLDIDFEILDFEKLSHEASNIDAFSGQLEGNEDTLELFHQNKEAKVKPISLLETGVKSDFQLDYKREVIANEIGIDIDSFNELFNDFLEESKDICTQIKNAIENKNTELCRAEAIKLKGMSENMRIKELSAELGTIISGTQASEAMNAIKKIDAILSQIGA